MSSCYKKKECKYYKEGYCHWGKRCKFYHDVGERIYYTPVSITYNLEEVKLVGIGLSYNEALSNLIGFVNMKKKENDEFWSKVQHLITIREPDLYEFCTAMII